MKIATGGTTADTADIRWHLEAVRHELRTPLGVLDLAEGQAEAAGDDQLPTPWPPWAIALWRHWTPTSGPSRPWTRSRQSVGSEPRRRAEKPRRQLYRLGDPDRADLRTGLTGFGSRLGTNLKRCLSWCPVDVPLPGSQCGVGNGRTIAWTAHDDEFSSRDRSLAVAEQPAEGRRARCQAQW